MSQCVINDIEYMSTLETTICYHLVDALLGYSMTLVSSLTL